MLPQIDTSSLSVSTLHFLPELVACLGVVLLLLVPLLADARKNVLLAFGLPLLVAGLAVFLAWATREDSLKSILSPKALSFLEASWLVSVLLVILGLVFLLALFLRVDAGSRKPVNVAAVALMTTLLSLGLSIDQGLFHQFLDGPEHRVAQLMFGERGAGLLVYDSFTVSLRIFLYAFACFVICLSITTGIPDREDGPDFYILLLGSTIGMVLMASSVHLLMVFIAIEMASLPSYALAGFRKGQRQASEAALKYVVYGGGAAGIMLYGISLLVGTFGTGYLPEVALGVVSSLGEGQAGMSPVVILGLVFVFIGVAFKLAAVPFHFWCPDVFEGATAEVAGFLSVASKAAALALLARLTMMFSGLDPLVGASDAVKHLPWKTVAEYLIPGLAFFAALTATFGNLAAYAQTNLKRLLAYSTIAHAGYMMMGLATLSRAGVEAVLFYLVAYLFMNLGAFAVVAFLRNMTRSEDLADFRGLVRRAPVLVITLSFFLLSLLGIPPLVGFPAKFQIFSVLWDEGRAFYQADEPGLGAILMGLLVIGGLNTVISAFYYLRVMKVMILDRQAEDIEGKEVVALAEPVSMQAYSMLFAAAVLVLGVLWGPVAASSRQGVVRFRLQPDVDLVQSKGTDTSTLLPGGGGAKGKAKDKGKGKGKGGGKKGGKGKGAMAKKPPMEE